MQKNRDAQTLLGICFMEDGNALWNILSCIKTPLLCSLFQPIYPRSKIFCTGYPFQKAAPQQCLSLLNGVGAILLCEDDENSGDNTEEIISELMKAVQCSACPSGCPCSAALLKQSIAWVLLRSIPSISTHLLYDGRCLRVEKIL